MAILVWFQRDLRIHNNPMLNWALRQNQSIIAVYIHSPDEDAQWNIGAASAWWLHHSLQSLAEQLQTLNITLHYFKGNSVNIIPKLARSPEITGITWTKRYEPYRIQCELKIVKQLKQQKIKINTVNPFLLSQPEHFLTKSKQQPYRVFTPFYKRLRTQLIDKAEILNTNFDQLISRRQHIVKNQNLSVKPLDLAQLNLLGSNPWYKKLHKFWVPGETPAANQLHNFIHIQLEYYNLSRDFPAADKTSRLSPHIHFGEISIKEIVSSLKEQLFFQTSKVTDSTECFLRQIIWREFANYLLLHFPGSVEHNMDSRFNNNFWAHNQEHLERWQTGNTGIPIIDAAMQQLWQSGWIHNRTRMLCASFLTKNLGIHWLDGARWFWDTLVDADLANNTMGWQWVAGCGVDAAPYFRIFNPLTQQERFDPENRYVKRWNCKQNINPMINLKQSREDALLRYRMIKSPNPK